VYRGHGYYTQEYDDVDEPIDEDELEAEFEKNDFFDDDEDEEEENVSHFLYFTLNSKFVKTNTTKPYHQTTKINGRQPKVIITKHDPKLSGMKNAQSLERTLDSGNMRNLKISNPVFNSLKENAKKLQVKFRSLTLKKIS
jgi:hypothetical protein